MKRHLSAYGPQTQPTILRLIDLEAIDRIDLIE